MKRWPSGAGFPGQGGFDWAPKPTVHRTPRKYANMNKAARQRRERIVRVTASLERGEIKVQPPNMTHEIGMTEPTVLDADESGSRPNNYYHPMAVAAREGRRSLVRASLEPSEASLARAWRVGRARALARYRAGIAPSYASLEGTDNRAFRKAKSKP